MFSFSIYSSSRTKRIPKLLRRQKCNRVLNIGNRRISQQLFKGSFKELFIDCLITVQEYFTSTMSNKTKCVVLEKVGKVHNTVHSIYRIVTRLLKLILIFVLKVTNFNYETIIFSLKKSDRIILIFESDGQYWFNGCNFH